MQQWQPGAFTLFCETCRAPVARLHAHWRHLPFVTVAASPAQARPAIFVSLRNAAATVLCGKLPHILNRKWRNHLGDAGNQAAPARTFVPVACKRTAFVVHLVIALDDEVRLNLRVQRAFDQVALAGKRDAVIVCRFGCGDDLAAVRRGVAKPDEIHDCPLRLNLEVNKSR